MRRRERQSAPRDNRLNVRFTPEEFTDVSSAAHREGMAIGAWCARAALAAARHEVGPVAVPAREVLIQLMQATEQVRKIGVNFNQVVKVLNATGEPRDDLLPYAGACMREVRKLDEIAELVRRRIR